MTREPSVTPQELRDLSDEIPWHPNIRQFVTEKTVQKMRQRLREHADWLELHMPLYREAVELVKVAGQRESFVSVSIGPNSTFAERREALLAKVKGAMEKAE